MMSEVFCDYCHLPIPSRLFPAISAPERGPCYCCYGCRFAAQITQARGEKGQAVWMLTRLGVAVFLSMSVMVCSLYLYGQDVYLAGLSADSAASKTLTSFMQYSSLVLATPVLFLLGLPILLNAAAQWRNGVVSTDALIVVGVASAFVYSYVSTLREAGSTYYETACMILVLVTLGRWLEASGKLRASEAVDALEALLPEEVSIRRNGDTMTVPAKETRIGDQVVVPAGQRIVVDGVIDSGRASIDEQIVTGESTPVVKQISDFVRAGTVNLDGALTVRATAVGAQSTVGRLTALLEAAKRSKGRYERLSDRIAAIFLPVTICVALTAGIWGYLRGGADGAVMSGLAVLLIACPCALGIATPMAIWVALGRAAAGGVLFRNGEAIEKLAKIRAFCFDKTGTLTTGVPKVVAFTGSLDGNDTDNEKAVSLAAGLAATSKHVAAQGVLEFSRNRGAIPAGYSQIGTIAGRGLVGTGDDGEVCMGNELLMREREYSFGSAIQRAIRWARERGHGITCVGWDRAVRGVFELTEHRRKEGKRAIAALRALGCRVMVLTGDHQQRGQFIADSLSVETRAELLPEDKVRCLEETRRELGPVAMVGDGLNDAPALAAADVGIAMGCGADVSREAASICLLGDDLEMLPRLLILARRTIRTIKINLFWAFFYNVIGMSLAATGKLSPIIAAGAMVASSLFVVTNSLRLGVGTESFSGRPVEPRRTNRIESADVPSPSEAVA